jgi:hypothetical protein
VSVRMKGGWEVNERRLARLRRGAKKQEWLGARRVSGADTLDALLCSYGLTARGGSSTLRPSCDHSVEVLEGLE